MRRSCVWLAVSAIMTFSIPAFAQTSGSVPAQASSAAEVEQIRAQVAQLQGEFKALRDDYGQRLAALEAKLVVMASAPATTPVPSPSPAAIDVSTQAATPPPVPVAADAPVLGSAVGGGSKVFNPDIAVIGDFLGAAGRNPVDPQPALQLHETEASFQAFVDPYARADFFISFGEAGVNVEEGFITFPTVPGGFVAKVGKMRAQFGKVNTLHNHVLPWTDRPLVIGSLLGGEDGIDDAGLSLAHLIPNPWLFLEATGEVYRGDSGVFKSSERSDLSYVGRLRGYKDITEGSNLDFGTSFAYGHNDAAPGLVTRVNGIDATFRYKPLQRSVYRSFIARSEFIWNKRDQPNGLQDGFGYYVSGDYQFSQRWFVGLRHDQSSHRDDAHLTDTGNSFLLTFWPSEFSQVRGQYRRTQYVDQLANEFLFQFQFAIGAHGAHVF